MRELVAVEFLSVDGVMQGLGSPDEDRDGGFEHGGWGAPYASAIDPSAGSDGLSPTTAYLFGRRTYDSMAAFWPYAPADNPFAAHLTATPKYVASATLTEPGWQNTEVLRGDLVGEVAALKRTGEGDIVILGSGQLARTLMAAGLVDRLQLFVHPLLLGTGKRLFGDLPTPRALTLEHCSTTALGSVVLTYRFSPQAPSAR